MAEAAPEELREDFRSRVNAWIKKNFYQPNEVLWNNEVQANLFAANVMLGTAALILLVVLLSLIKPFPGESGKTRGVLILAALLVAAPAGVCYWKKGEKKWMKLLLLAAYAVVLAQVESVLTSGVFLGLLFPIILSIRYYSRAMTLLTGLLTAVFLLIASWLSVILRLGTVDLNLLELPGGTVLRFAERDSLYHAVMSQAEIDTRQLWHSTLVQSYLPRLILLVLITLICAEIAKRGRILLFEEHEEIKKTERISMELDLAKSIQKNMIPNLYPAFPDRKEFDVYARMEPAKELGGDFYDYYMIDRDHLALIIADVSGKGIPAAMFMMAAKSMINNRAKSRSHDPAKILKAVNKQMTDNNASQMFVTLWMGILEISTGKLTAANAGHEYPCLRQRGGAFELLEDQHSLVLGAMEDTEFTSYEVQLEPGDSLFVYTDGVTEATNGAEELFGGERMLDALNRDPDAKVTQIVDSVQNAMNDFVDGAPQFDDFTMLAMKFYGEEGPEEPEEPEKSEEPAEKKEEA